MKEYFANMTTLEKILGVVAILTFAFGEGAIADGDLKMGFILLGVTLALAALMSYLSDHRPDKRKGRRIR